MEEAEGTDEHPNLETVLATLATLLRTPYRECSLYRVGLQGVCREEPITVLTGQLTGLGRDKGRPGSYVLVRPSQNGCPTAGISCHSHAHTSWTEASPEFNA